MSTKDACKHKWSAWIKSFFMEYRVCQKCGVERSRPGKAERR